MNDSFSSDKDKLEKSAIRRLEEVSDVCNKSIFSNES